MYLRDDTWQEELSCLAEGAQAIVMEPGRTRSLRWELAYIAQHGLQTRLFIVTPPYARRWALQRWVLRLMDLLNGWHTVTWSEFAEELRTAPLEAPSDDPGPGAVISFSADGSPIVLATDLKTPTAFVDVIARRSHDLSARDAR